MSIKKNHIPIKKKIKKRSLSSKTFDEQDEIALIRHDQDDFICPICLKFIVGATTTVCGHTFCHLCISDYLLYFSSCLRCSRNIRKDNLGLCKILDRAIEEFVEQKFPEDKEDFKQRLAMMKEFFLDKNDFKLEAGLQLDVRDRNFIWRRAVVKRLFYKQQHSKYVSIHFLNQHQTHDEDLYEQSDRFAKKGFYTDREQVPKIDIYSIEETKLHQYISKLKTE